MSLSRRAAEERLLRGTSDQIIASEAEATAAKTARLRAARMKRDVAEATDAEIEAEAPPV